MTRTQVYRHVAAGRMTPEEGAAELVRLDALTARRVSVALDLRLLMLAAVLVGLAWGACHG